MIDKLSATPVYLQLVAILRKRIESGELQPDRPLPSEPYLAAEYGVARGTVRHAIAILRDEGLVVTVPGRGNFVAG
ncbi:MAG: transcriptional regulator, GntR family [Dactylosporangium sp.]|nr:transcriptional regulator, GntR family [Dactylosporangium sp.]